MLGSCGVSNIANYFISPVPVTSIRQSDAAVLLYSFTAYFATGVV